MCSSTWRDPFLSPAGVPLLCFDTIEFASTPVRSPAMLLGPAVRGPWLRPRLHPGPTPWRSRPQQHGRVLSPHHGGSSFLLWRRGRTCRYQEHQAVKEMQTLSPSAGSSVTRSHRIRKSVPSPSGVAMQLCQVAAHRGVSCRNHVMLATGSLIYLHFRINQLFIFIYLFFLFLAVLGLRFCARAFSSCGKRGPLFIAVQRPLTIAASLVVEHRFQTRRLSSCGSWAQLLRSMWDLPRPGFEPVSPALAGGFSTTAPPGKPKSAIF